MADEDARRKKQEKKARQARERKGANWVPEEQFVSHDDREFQAQSIKAASYWADATKMRTVAAQFHPDVLRVDRPDIFAFLSSGKPITVTKSMDPVQVAAIWYLELDKKHCFNTFEKVPAACYAAAVMASYNYLCDKSNIDVKPALLIPYAIACHEQQFFPDQFIMRDRFIQLWLSSPDDIPQYGNKQCDRITKAARDLERAVNGLGGADPFAERVQDLQEVIDDEAQTEELNDEGEGLVDETMKGDSILQDGENVRWYSGEDSIIPDLSSQPEEYREMVHREWVTAMMDVMQGLLDQLESQTVNRDVERIEALRAKLLKFWELLSLKKMAGDLGFDKFA